MKTFQTYLLYSTVPFNSSKTRHQILLEQTMGVWFAGFFYRVSATSSAGERRPKSSSRQPPDKA